MAYKKKCGPVGGNSGKVSMESKKMGMVAPSSKVGSAKPSGAVSGLAKTGMK